MSASYKIQPFKKGDTARTPMHSDAINELVSAINRNERIIPSGLGEIHSGKDEKIIDLSDLESRLQELEEAAGTAAAAHPWRPKIDAIDPLKYQIAPGYVRFGNVMLFPTNRNAEFTAPPENTSGYFTWLECSFSGGADVSSALMTDVSYGSGTDLPDAPSAGSTGAPPVKLYIPLFYVTTTETAIDHVEQLYSTPISVSVVVEDFNCSTKLRSFVVHS